jgi:hypothetical protein
MKLHSEARGDVGMRSALIVSNSGMTTVQGETRKCYNYGEVGHLSKTYLKPPTERERQVGVDKLKAVGAEEVEEEATGRI